MDPTSIELGERRRFERRTRRYPLEILSEVGSSRATLAETLNVTASGLYAVTSSGDSLLTLGSKVLVRLRHPGAANGVNEELTGTVIRVESLNEDGREMRGFAIKFTESQPRFA
jgi:hypothetical protein